MSKPPELTAEQDARLQEYRNRAAKACVNTDRIDRPAARRTIESLWEFFGKRPPEKFSWYESPGDYLQNGRKFFRDSRQVPADPKSTIELDILDNYIWKHIVPYRDRHLVLSARSKLLNPFQPYFRRVFEFIPRGRRPIVPKDRAFLAEVGQADVSEILFYLYCAQVLGLHFERTSMQFLHVSLSVAESCYCWWCAGDRCAVSERPIIVKTEQWGEGRRIHCDDGPTIVFSDGCSVYALHGVPVPQQVVETPAGALDPKIVLRERNAEVRREIIRKIGLEQVLIALEARKLDRMGNYELVELDLGAGRRRPYLSMINPSTGTSHIEGVHPNCTTVREALSWRNGTPIPPEQMT